MADVALARPLPTVLQPVDIRSRRGRVVSFSSVSEGTPSSNPYSGESWFQVSASHSCTSYHLPLPKGARPASPQPTRIFELDTRSHGTGSDRSQSFPKRSGSFSSWKPEWRGISKVVKWAVLGDKSDDASKPRSASLRMEKDTRDGDYEWEPVFHRLDKPLPRDPPEPGFSPYIYSSPTSPLSPSTSATCVDIDDDCHYSHSEFGPVLGSRFPTSEVHLSSHKPPPNADDLVRRSRWNEASRCETHVRALKYTNVPRAASELGYGDPYGSTFDMQGAFSDVNQSTTSLESSHDWSHSRRVAHSDLGHIDGTRTMPRAAFSSLSLSYGGHDHFNVKQGTNLRPFKNVQLMQAAGNRPVSTPSKGTPVTAHRRPRKLQKSPRAAPTSEGRTNHLAVNSLSSPSSPASHGPTLPKAPFYSAALTGPLVPPKPRPRPPRKLKKKPSPALPPLPRTVGRVVSEDPPPVPPKYIPDTKDICEIDPGATSLSCSAGCSADSPALTDTSVSVSPDDDLNSSQESSATSEDINGKPPAKRPSLLRTESNRRWTVAAADVPDDLFIEELERLRRMGLRAGDVHGVYDILQSSYALSSTMGTRQGSSDGDDTRCSEANQLEGHKSTIAVSVQEIGAEDEMEWLHARRAILCCRELVRTERSYQERLQELADGNVSDAVPALLLQYLPALIGASKVLTARFNEDLSAYGISCAFLSVALTLERALVPWSGVVGEFFGSNRDPSHISKRKRDAAVIPEDVAPTEFGAVKVRCMSMHDDANAYAANSSSLQVLNTEAITTSSTHWLFRSAFTQSPAEGPYDGEALFGLRKSFRRREVKIKEEKERRRKPPFRDLAILPTQRVTRYVLLYKDLLKHTPISSPGRGLVEKAVEAAVCIATKCDRAQDNSTFLFHD